VVGDSGWDSRECVDWSLVAQEVAAKRNAIVNPDSNGITKHSYTSGCHQEL
jgi:hypothetical protein